MKSNLNFDNKIGYSLLILVILGISLRSSFVKNYYSESLPEETNVNIENNNEDYTYNEVIADSAQVQEQETNTIQQDVLNNDSVIHEVNYLKFNNPMLNFINDRGYAEYFHANPNVIYYSDKRHEDQFCIYTETGSELWIIGDSIEVINNNNSNFKFTDDEILIMKLCTVWGYQVDYKEYFASTVSKFIITENVQASNISLLFYKDKEFTYQKFENIKSVVFFNEYDNIKYYKLESKFYTNRTSCNCNESSDVSVLIGINENNKIISFEFTNQTNISRTKI